MATVVASVAPAAVQQQQLFGLTSNTKVDAPEKPGGGQRVVVPTVKDTNLRKLRAAAPMAEAATAIQQLAEEKGLGGFTGTSIEKGKLVLYWNGELPAEVAKAVDTKVEVRSAPYPATVLDAEARRISALPGVTGTAFLEDFSGIWVGVADAKDTSRLATQLNSRVKVEVRTQQAGEPLAWRWGDTAPFWGGAVVEHRSGSWPFYSYSYCTTGFAASQNGGADAMTFSDHCGNPGDQWHTPEPGEDGLHVGYASGEVPSIDGAFLYGAGYAPRSYIGPNNSASGVAINGLIYPSMNMPVCYEGGFSGASCNSHVTATGAYFCGVGPGFWTEDPSHQAAAGQGDSGGPVLGPSSGSGLNGVGIITCGDVPATQVACQGIQDRVCSWRVFNTNLGTALIQQSLTLRTTTF